MDAGIFVKAVINGFDLNTLVDTGATLSLVDKRVYDCLIDSNNSFETLREVSQPHKNRPSYDLSQTQCPDFRR